MRLVVQEAAVTLDGSAAPTLPRRPGLRDACRTGTPAGVWAAGRESRGAECSRHVFPGPPAACREGPPVDSRAGQGVRPHHLPPRRCRLCSETFRTQVAGAGCVRRNQAFRWGPSQSR